MLVDSAALVDDLAGEMMALTTLVRDVGTRLDDPVTSEGWTVRDTIVHLIETDQLASRALSSVHGECAAIMPPARPDGLRTAMMIGAGALSLSELLDTRRIACRELLAVASGRPAGHRVAWGPATMRAGSLLQARIMEHWAHGVDISTVLGLPIEKTSRLHHVIDLAFRGRRVAFARAQDLLPPGDVAARLRAPDGALWSWGSASDHVVSGPAEDFALVAVRRMAPMSSGLVVSSAPAARWVELVQAFGGPLAPFPQA